ncbi:hypothetical protein FRC11_010328 [Ceratobasidium sp. 423]|nr:hypothetical protein FRC11_010328 [Ceratobasidium sp. 423]
MEGQLPVPAETVEKARDNIAARHLDQLQHLPLSREKPPVEGDLPEIEAPSTLDNLKQWSKDNAAQIQKAVKNKAFGGPDGHWENAFLAFMEAATTYLRDWSKVVDAVEAYNKGENKIAFERLRESTADIEEIAGLWGMKFQLLCDLTEKSGQGADSRIWNGPYCGAFYSKDSNAPFVGVAFKGTNPTNWKDILVDINTATIQAGEGIVYNTNVSKGVFNGMFKGEYPKRAFGLSDLVPNIPNTEGQPVRTHVAGHSLGGSYSNLCFTQLTVPNVLPQLAILGDLYTFGCPRIGYEDFASAVKKHLGPKTGSSWRIANAGDLVPQVPPVNPFPWPRSQFNHLNNGRRISPSVAPVVLPSEIGTKTRGPDLWPPSTWTIAPHYTTSYYASMLKAMSSPPRDASSSGFSVYIAITNLTTEVLHLVDKSSESSETYEHHEHLGEWVDLPDEIPPVWPVDFVLKSRTPFEGSSGTFTYKIGIGENAPRFTAFQTCPFGSFNRVDVKPLPGPYVVSLRKWTGFDHPHTQDDDRVPISGWPLRVEYTITDSSKSGDNWVISEEPGAA